MGSSETVLGSEKNPLARPTGVLSYLFRQVFDERVSDAARWKQLVTVYAERTDDGVAIKRSIANSDRRNKKTALSSANMYWKTFIEGIAILGPKTVYMTAFVTRDDGTTFNARIPLQLKSLSSFLAELVLEMRIDPNEWDANMKAYISGTNLHLADYPKVRSTYRGNLDKALGTPNMTWRTLQHGLLAHRFILFKYRIVCTWVNGSRTISEYTAKR